MRDLNKQVFVTGLALLAMFLGAGNLIFPPMLGLQAGDDLWPTILGFILTGVGLPLMGVAAVAKADGDLEHLANRVHPLFSKIITVAVILLIGPLLAIPRTAATTFEVAVNPFWNGYTQIGLLSTTVLFFLITLFFVLRPTRLLDNIAKILTPFLVLFLGIIIVKGVLSPAGQMGPGQFATPFSQGFLEGYNTMDALASVIFGLVIVNSIKAKGITDRDLVAKITIGAGVIAAIGLSAIYIGIGYIGATTGTLYTGDNHGQMLSFVTATLLGSTGQMVIAVAMTLACLTTSIGLVASCGAYFSRLTNNRVSYNQVCLLTVLVSASLANLGLAKILEFSVPLLITIYPIIIVLILLSLFHGLFQGKKSVYVASISVTTALTGINLIGTWFNVNWIGDTMALLPLAGQGLEWMLPALIFALFAFFTGTTEPEIQSSMNSAK
ncbi:LIVCS family branched-chain amino acid:cation transporter [Desulfitispora alkaliphila]|uniref:branched-chain amino acid transport system II carrier protein n=1 Tax=Desulfitispora alkaliphila TaxID=622674 RepID=UPI003D1A6689